MPRAERYVVVVDVDRLSSFEPVAFRPPSAQEFPTYEQARIWCEALNRCLGQPVFVVRRAGYPESGALGGQGSETETSAEASDADDLPELAMCTR